MLATDILRQDHRRIEQLFARFFLEVGDEARREILNEIVRELSVHAGIEEEVVYPVALEVLSSGEDLVGDSLEEHRGAKSLLLELDRMEAGDPAMEETLTILERDLRHHIDDEELKLFPLLEMRLNAEILNSLGDELEEARGRAPTRPHPLAPDSPPAMKVTSPIAALIDRIRDHIQGRSA